MHYTFVFPVSCSFDTEGIYILISKVNAHTKYVCLNMCCKFHNPSINKHILCTEALSGALGVNIVTLVLVKLGLRTSCLDNLYFVEHFFVKFDCSYLALKVAENMAFMNLV